MKKVILLLLLHFTVYASALPEDENVTSVEHPVDMTSWIVTPRFDNNDVTTGWSGDIFSNYYAMLNKYGNAECYSCINIHAQWKGWKGDSRSYVVELYKRIIHNQDLHSMIWDDYMIKKIHKHKRQLLQGYGETEILSLVEKAESFTDGEWLDTIYQIHFPNGADVYFQITDAETINHIWLPDGSHICNFDVFFYRPAIINDPDGYVNIREKADGTSKIVGKLKARELFYFTPISGSDWYKVYHHESQPCLGYIHKSRITTFKDFPEDLKEKVRKIRGGC